MTVGNRGISKANDACCFSFVPYLLKNNKTTTPFQRYHQLLCLVAVVQLQFPFPTFYFFKNIFFFILVALTDGTPPLPSSHTDI